MNAETITVVIDDQPHTLDRRRVTREHLLSLVPPGVENISLDIDGAQDRTLVPGQELTVTNGMVFFTDRQRPIFLDGIEYQVRSRVISETEIRNLTVPPVDDTLVIYRDVVDAIDKQLAPGELIKVDAGTRFFTSKRRERTIKVFVNSRPKLVDSPRVSFEQVVALAFPDGPTGVDITYTVTYSRAAGPRPEGSLTPGAVVRVKDGAVFDVFFTDKS